MRPPALGLFLAFGVAALPGCLKYKDHTVLLPDGSGKISVSISMKSGMLKLAEEAAREEGLEADVESLLVADAGALQRRFEGIVAFTEPVERKEGGWTSVTFTEPVERKEGGWTSVTFTGYFEDVNKVRAWNEDAEGGGRRLMTSFRFSKQGEGFALEQTARIFEEFADLPDLLGEEEEGLSDEAAEALDEMARSMLKSLFEGMDLASSVEMPGKVTKCEGRTSDKGRIASSAIGIEDVLDETRRRKLKGHAAAKVWCGAPEVSAAAIKSFREEMAAAKKAWESRLAAWVKERGPVPTMGVGGGAGVRPAGPPPESDGGSKLPPELR